MSCPRLVGYREQLRRENPSWHNAPVPAFLAPGKPRLLIVGLAPGKSGANRTGRPFTGDFAGRMLYSLLAEFGFSGGDYRERKDDGLVLRDCAVVNAVACVPPANKPTGSEIAACRTWLAKRIESMEQLQAILVLGRIAHETVAKVFGAARRDVPFRHGARYPLDGGIELFASYHCSRYNVNTGRVDREMLRDVFERIRRHLESGH